jgi:uncharacterized damage-inducible protein DinB
MVAEEARMSIAESLLPEFDHEMATTRKLLDRVPADKVAWKPHAKSFSLGDLSLHLGELCGWTQEALTKTELDINPPGGQSYTRPPFESKEALLKAFDESATKARAAIAKATDAEFMVGWTLKAGGQAIFTIPRVAVIRTWVMNHIIHHRGQLSVYLRLLDVPVPSIYGPSADDQGM